MSWRRARLVVMAVVVAALTTACAVAGSGRDASPAGRAARYCDALRGFAELDLLFDESPERVRSDLDELLALTKRVARLAPREIRADAQAAVAAQERFNALYAANGWDPEATNRDPEFIDHANDPELGALYVRLQDYQTRVCGPEHGRRIHRSPEPGTAHAPRETPADREGAMSGRGVAQRVGRAGSFAIVVAAYVTAVGAGWGVAEAVGGTEPVLALGLGYLTSALVIFVWSTALDNGSMFDAWWSVLPPLAAAWLAVQHTSGVPGLRIALVLVVVWVWAVRLTSNWARDWPGLGHEDWRYLDLYAKGPKLVISLTSVHLFPCGVVFLGSLPMVPALAWGTDDVGVLDVIALVVGLGASAIELVADEQMRRFRRTKTPDQVMDRGMWAWSRHPNYFGELCFWWALWGFALAADPAWWWTIVGPLAMTAMFLFASIPMLDRRSLERRPEFADYAARTPALVPRRPRRPRRS